MLMSGLFRITSPVLFGYFPLGITFGILFQDLGYPWYSATLMGLVVYAGAAQFMAIGLLTAGASLSGSPPGLPWSSQASPGGDAEKGESYEKLHFSIVVLFGLSWS